MAFDIGPVVTDGGGGTMYAVGADIGDYIRCGNPYAACAVPAARGSVRETICDPFGYRCRRLNWGMDGRFPARPNTVNNLRNVLTFKHLSKRELEGWQEQ